MPDLSTALASGYLQSFLSFSNTSEWNINASCAECELADHRSRPELRLRAQLPGQSDDPAPASGSAGSVPPWHTRRALRTAARDRDSCEWFHFRYQGQSAACLQLFPKYVQAWE